jgi:hypothetical protein
MTILKPSGWPLEWAEESDLRCALRVPPRQGAISPTGGLARPALSVTDRPALSPGSALRSTLFGPRPSLELGLFAAGDCLAHCNLTGHLGGELPDEDVLTVDAVPGVDVVPE